MDTQAQTALEERGSLKWILGTRKRRLGWNWMLKNRHMDGRCTDCNKNWYIEKNIIMMSLIDRVLY